METETLKSKHLPTVILATTLIGLLAAPFFSWLTLVLGIILFASVTVLRLGIVARLVVAALVFATVGAIAVEIMTLLGGSVNFDVLQGINLLLAAAYAFYFRQRIGFKTSAVDIVGMLVAGVIFAVAASPYFGASHSKTLDLLIPGEDNGSHLQMFRYVLTEGRYAYQNEVDNSGIRPSLLSYAQGSHAAMATIASPFVDNSRESQLKAYVYISTATFAMIFWLLFLTIAQPLLRLKSTPLRLILSGILACFITLSVPFGMLFNLYTFGYFPQNLAYVGLAFLFLVTLLALEPIKTNDRGNSLLIEVALLLIGCYLVFSSWYLLAPIIAPLLAVYLFVRWRELWARKFYIIALALPFVVLIGYLAYVYLFLSSGSSHLLTTGGVTKMRIRLLVVCILALFIGFLALRQKKWFTLGASLSLVAAGIMSAFIAIYQTKKIGHLDYYFYKSLYTVVIIAVVYYGYLLVDALSLQLKDLPVKRRLELSTVLPLAGLIITACLLTSFSPPKYLSEYQARASSTAQAAPKRLLDIYTDESKYIQYSDVIFLGDCNPYTNFTGTIWAGAYLLPYSGTRGELEIRVLGRADELSVPNSPLLKEVADYAATKSLPVAVQIEGIYCQHEATMNIKDQLGTADNIILVDAHGNPVAH